LRELSPQATEGVKGKIAKKKGRSRCGGILFITSSAVPGTAKRGGATERKMMN